MFLSKNHDIEIDFLTFDPFLFKNLPPTSKNENFPMWFKNNQSYFGESVSSEKFSSFRFPTIKKCPAINDYFLTGIDFPLWSDVDFFIDTKNKSIDWRYSNDYKNLTLVNSHPPDQFSGLSEKFLHVKIVCPWIASCNKNISWLMTRPTYSNFTFDEQGVVFCDGITQFKNNFVMNVNLFFPLNRESYSVSFSAGEKFFRLIPLSEKKISINLKECTEEYFKNAALINRKISFSTAKLYRMLGKK
jgi:hypothetical protein